MVLVEVEELVVVLEAEVELEVVAVVLVMGMMKVMASAGRCAPWKINTTWGWCG